MHACTQPGEVANRILSVGSTKRAELLSEMLDPHDGGPMVRVLSSRGFLTVTGKGHATCYRKAKTDGMYRHIQRRSGLHHLATHGHAQPGLCCPRKSGCGFRADGGCKARDVRCPPAPCSSWKPHHSSELHQHPVCGSIERKVNIPCHPRSIYLQAEP